MTGNLFHSAQVRFEAARNIGIDDAALHLKSLHGHSFQVRLRARLPEGHVGFPGDETRRLHKLLIEASAPLDFNEINRHIPIPTDLAIARWLRDRLKLQGVTDINRLSLQSVQGTGVDLDENNIPHHWRRFRLEAAHRLPNVPAGHKCGRMHGHGFEVLLHSSADLGAEHHAHLNLDEAWAPLHAELDHACLNDIAGLENPTSEMLAQWLWQRLHPQVATLSWVTVFETASCGAMYDGAGHRIWKEATLDSATRLLAAPEQDARRRLHGHTYTLRLHLHAPLDTVRGWTVDFGDVKRLFDPVFLQIDHQALHELPGIADGDTADIARWIFQATERTLMPLERIDLDETPGNGVVLAGNNTAIALPI